MSAPTPGDEFVVIERLRTIFEATSGSNTPSGGTARSQPEAGDVWIGDDAAVVTLGGGPGQPARTVMATDLIVEGVHVDLDWSTPEDVGWKAMSVTVSDLAALGADPGYALVSVAAPGGTDLDRLAGGMADAAAMYGCRVVGGDLSESTQLVVSVALVGWLRGPPGPLLRSGASPGDHLFVTGPLGGSAAGLRLLRTGDATSEPSEAALVDAHRRPVARLAEGRAARSSGATAAIDLSDGLGADVRHLATASSVGVRLASIPVTRGATSIEALGGGEDYELLIATGDPERLEEAFAAEGLRAPIPIGGCTDRPGRYLLDGEPLGDHGWHHRF